MDRAVSDQRQGALHRALAWTRGEPGRAALWTLVFIAVVTACLALFGAPSWAISRRSRSSRSAQPIKFRILLPVDTTSDESTEGDGFCSLREAITTSNAAGGLTNDCGTGSGFDTIKFTVSGTIGLVSALPAITQNLIIDGTGQTIAISGQFSRQVLAVNSGATLAVNELTLENGSISGGNGGEIVNSGSLEVTNCLITGSINVNDGGGIFNDNGATATVMNSTISSNSATFAGGIENLGTLTLTNSTISGNSAAIPDGFGGGIDNEGTVTATNSTISGNSAAAGGGIDNDTGTLTVTNSTIAGNFATNAGGIANIGTLTLTNTTIWGSFGGGLSTNDNIATLKNTIIANSVSGGNCVIGGTFVSDGHNLSDDNSCNGFLAGTGDLNHTPAGLDPNGLQNYGGPTQTIALLPTSPAVDAVPTSPTNYCTEVDGVTPITTDQRGDPRPDPEDSDLVTPACDIGAFELNAVDATPTPTATATSAATATASATATATATATTTASETATATSTPTSTPTPVAGKLKVSPKILKFGTVALNAPPKAKTVTVTNAGKIKKKNHPLPILIEMESVDGTPPPSPFSITTHCDDDNLMPGGKGVPKGETMCTIAVQFKPTEAVSYSGTLTIFDNLQPSEMQKVQMTGKGKAGK